MPFGSVKAQPRSVESPSVGNQAIQADSVLSNIDAAARDNARYIRPWRELSERDDEPFQRRGSESEDYGDAIILQRRASGRYDVFSTHTSLYHYGLRPRVVCKFLQEKVLPLCTTNVSGCYRFCFDDIVSDNENCLVFSKKQDQSLALFPDLFQIADYTCCSWKTQLASQPESVPFESKKPLCIFAGAATGGDPDILKNERVQACVWSASGNADVSSFTLSNLLSVWPRAVADRALTAPIVDKIVGGHVSVHEQLAYQSVLSVDGNTAAWDRPVWVMGSQSVLLKKSSPYECWYPRPPAPPPARSMPARQSLPGNEDRERENWEKGSGEREIVLAWRRAQPGAQRCACASQARPSRTAPATRSPVGGGRAGALGRPLRLHYDLGGTHASQPPALLCREVCHD